MLKWAREQGCPWDPKVCSCAAERGHLDVLKWAREQGCPWGEEVVISATRGGHLEILKWLTIQKCPRGGFHPTAAAAAGGTLKF